MTGTVQNLSIGNQNCGAEGRQLQNGAVEDNLIAVCGQGCSQHPVTIGRQVHPGGRGIDIHENNAFLVIPGLPLGTDFTIWDLDAEYEVDPAEFASLGKASTFTGWKVMGRCMATVCDGRVVYREKE